MLELHEDLPVTLLTLGFSDNEKTILENSLNTIKEERLAHSYYKAVHMNWYSKDQVLYATSHHAEAALFLLISPAYAENSDFSIDINESLSQYLPIILVADTLEENENNKFFISHISSSFEKENLINIIDTLSSRSQLLHEKNRISNERNMLQDLFYQKRFALNFLVNFTEEVVNSKNINDLFERVRTCFESIFDLQSMHIAFWDKEVDSINKVNYYIGTSRSAKEVFHAWEERIHSLVTDSFTEENQNNARELVTDYLKTHKLSAVRMPESLTSRLYDDNIEFSYEVESIEAINSPNVSPNIGTTFIIPLMIYGEKVGLLILQIMESSNYGKDMSHCIDSACSHLAYAFENLYSNTVGIEKTYFATNSNYIGFTATAQ